MSALESPGAHDTERTVTQRPIRPDDAERLARLFDRLSPTSRYRRFFSPVAKLPRTMLHRLAIVDDDWQRAGIATFLLDRLAREARAHGVETFTATVLADNVPAVALTRTLNRFARMQGTGPERTLVMPLRRPTPNPNSA